MSKRRYTREEVSEAVREVLIDALALDDDQPITPETHLAYDLGAESIDVLDIAFKVGRKFGIEQDQDQNWLNAQVGRNAEQVKSEDQIDPLKHATVQHVFNYAEERLARKGLLIDPVTSAKVDGLTENSTAKIKRGKITS